MNVTVHQRPGVYSAYDASSVVSGSGGGKQVGLVAVNTKATANEVKIVTSYDGAVNAFGQGTMAELIRLALKNGAGSVAAVPIASGEGYGDGFAALEGLEDVTAVICDSTDGDVQKAMKESVETASANRRERIAVAAGGAEETVDELIARAKALNHERVVLVAPGGVDKSGENTDGLGVAAAVAGAVPGLRLYSDLTEAALCAAIARHCGVQPENILCGNGSDENLLLALRAFCDETHPLAFADITYSFYPVLCDLLHIPQHVILVEEDFSLDLSKYHGLNETIVIANPNAPTTLLQPVAAIEEVVRTNPDSIVIVDEAYIDFAGPNASCVPLTKKYDNVIVVQTFSKSHNLAGARVGFCVANPELIADMNRIKFSYSPYNVNSLSQAAAVAAMEDENYFRDTVGKICATRADTMTKLRERGFTGPDSATNFLFVTTSRMPCKQIFERLRQKGVLIRYFSAPRLSDYLRITIGTPEQMQRFFEELDLILG